jgi:hypothetical protein
VALKPDEGTEVIFARANAGFCNFADFYEDISTSVAGEIE